MSMLCFKHLF